LLVGKFKNRFDSSPTNAEQIIELKAVRSECDKIQIRRQQDFMFEVSVEKAPTIQLPDLIDSVINGEEVIFTQNNLPIAKLVAVRLRKPAPAVWQRERIVRNGGRF